MGMPIAHERRWSVEDVWALPDDPHQRFETVDGELLVSPMPRFAHQRAVAKIGLMLGAYVKRQRVGELMFSPYDVVRGKVAPPPPYLAVEELSSSTARADRLRKRPRYQRAAIECWLIDLDSQLIERWTPDLDRPEICADRLVWLAPGAAEPLAVDVAALTLAILGSHEASPEGTTVQP